MMDALADELFPGRNEAMSEEIKEEEETIRGMKYPPIFFNQRIENRVALLRLLKFTGIGVEIGVASGWFSERILKFTQLSKLYSIDPWSRSPDEPIDAAHTSTLDRYNDAVAALAPYGERSEILVLTSADAALAFEDESLELVYIDADHQYESVKQDIELWYPKLRVGGLFAGHDYSGNCHGVMKAVDEFFREHNLHLNLTECDEVNYWTVRSWYTLKK